MVLRVLRVAAMIAPQPSRLRQAPLDLSLWALGLGRVTTKLRAPRSVHLDLDLDLRVPEELFPVMDLDLALRQAAPTLSLVQRVPLS